MHDIRAFTVGDARYFGGVVALVNSLRITGHAMPVTVLDVGFERWQRDLLADHCDVREARPGISPYLLKLDAPLASDTDVVLALDSDLIVTGSLSAMIDAAAAGQVAAYPDLDEERWFAEWADLFGLRAPLRRGVYLNSGAVAVSTRRMPKLLGRWAELCERMVGTALMERSEGPPDPLWLADQEALNALLLSEVPEEEIARCLVPGIALGTEDMAATRVDDLGALHCSLRGEPVTMLHAVGGIKPWQPRASREYRRTAYTACLRRVLSGPDIEIRVPPRHLPTWLRPGAPSTVLGGLLHAYDLGARTTRPFRRRVGLSSGRNPTLGGRSPSGHR